MPGGHDSEAEFQQFFKRLIQSKPVAETPQAQPLSIRDVIVNGPLRCKIYIGMPPGHAGDTTVRQQSPQTDD